VTTEQATYTSGKAPSVLKGTSFRATYALIQTIFREALAYFIKTMLNFILLLLQWHGFVVEESGCSPDHAPMKTDLCIMKFKLQQ